MTPAPARADGVRHHDDMNESEGCPLDTVPPDPGDLSPLGDEREFAAMLEELVADEKPRLFAVVQEYGERVDGRIAAWGMAFADHTEVIFAEYDQRMSLSAPDRALHAFSQGSGIRARLMWIDPAVAPPPGEAGPAADSTTV